MNSIAMVLNMTRTAALGLVLFLGFSLSLFADEDVKNLVHMQVQIFKDKEKNHYLALNFKNKKGWHTYWKNPGDAGTPLKHSFHVDGKEIELPALEWMPPSRFIEPGNLQAYGYDGQYAFFFPLDGEGRKNHFKELQNKILKINSQWLVCEHICVPGQKEVKGVIKKDQFEVLAGGPWEWSITASEQERFFSQIPQSAEFPQELLEMGLVRTEDEKNLVLYYVVKGVTKSLISAQRNLLTPFPESLLTFHHEELIEDSREKRVYGKMKMDWDGEYQEDGPVPLPKDGVFKKPFTLKFLFTNPLNKKVELIEKTFPQFDLKDNPLERAYLDTVKASSPEISFQNKKLEEVKKKLMESLKEI